MIAAGHCTARLCSCLPIKLIGTYAATLCLQGILLGTASMELLSNLLYQQLYAWLSR